MTLTVAEIRAFPATGAVYRKSDEKGLYLEVTPKGSKLWRLKYRFNGVEKRLAFREQTGHRTDAMLNRYIRDFELFRDNAAGKIL